MKKFTAFLAVALLLGFVSGCSDDDCPACPPTGDTTPNLTYVGSSTCGTVGCHDATYNMFIESGHPYKLTAVPGDQGPTYPWDAQHTNGAIVNRDGPPANTAWTDFAYVIGGYGWKARWVQPDGMVYIGTDVQLNLWGSPAPEWADYHVGKPTEYNYSCFKCHTTGASEEGSWPDGTTGFGTFEFGGVQCEECHGQGSQHASDPPKYEMTVDRSSALCGRCHTRDPQNRVEVSGGYIRHHEQYDEMVHSPHAAVGCNSCHDPHASVVYDDVAMGNGVTTPCLTCHGAGATYDASFINHNTVPTCENCHMPKAAKSARVTSNVYVADIASHTFKIDTMAVDKSAMWTSDGKFLEQDEFGRGRITLDFACYSCHADGAGGGGNQGRALTLRQLADRAQGIHTAPPPFARVSKND